ncbi:MAG: adenine deaminase [Nitrospirae bacterium]|nr:adenine deaminase [Nitrospirota bacterium]
MEQVRSVSGNIVDLATEEIYPGTLEINDDRITNIRRDKSPYDTYILPGLIDSHIHIESSMLAPSEFARIACIHGTVAAVSDPHEIANVLGIEGVDFMVRNGRSVPFKFFFSAPSCVPATPFETSGASLGLRETEELLKRDEIKYLGEVMNFPGVLANDPEVMGKVRIATGLDKKVDGHAPGLRGNDLRKYVEAGISTDHECLSREEAREKLGCGMKIMIREGSAARNFDDLAPLIEEHPEGCMFCCDDLHPHDLIGGQINSLVKKALAAGLDRMKVLRCACMNPVLHYGLELGLLQTGDFADFIVIDDFARFTVLKTVINGKLVSADGKTFIPKVKTEALNNFSTDRKRPSDFLLKEKGGRLQLIEAFDGQLITGRTFARPKVERGFVVSDPGADILKIAVVNRYRDRPPATGFIKGFGLKRGALASSVAHDSHNIVAVGVDDEDLCRAVNLVIAQKGGLAAVCGEREELLPLPLAGIMSSEDGYEVAERYSALDRMAKELGSSLSAPFMTLSFMALLVIPTIKLSDKGLFDGERFEFIDLFETAD